MSRLSNTGMETVGRPPSRGHSASCRLGSFNAGKFTGARIPFVYTVVDGYLAKHPQNASTVRGIFTNVAAGSTLMAECRRLTEATGRRWREGTLSAMLHNRLYLGEHVYHAEQKAVMRDVRGPRTDRHRRLDEGAGHAQGEPLKADLEAAGQYLARPLEMRVVWDYSGVHADERQGLGIIGAAIPFP